MIGCSRTRLNYLLSVSPPIMTRFQTFSPSGAREAGATFTPKFEQLSRQPSLFLLFRTTTPGVLLMI